MNQELNSKFGISDAAALWVSFVAANMACIGLMATLLIW